MQPSCSDGKEIPRTSKDDDVCEGERKPSVASVDYVTGSDSNSDPTLVTDCDSCIRNSSVAYSSRSDTSDSEDMFDKIVPRKHRKLASLVRTDPSSTSSSSESDDETGALGSKLDRQNTITEFIDEYKRFFRSVDTRDPKCVVKNRHKLVRPQTAKSQRTEPLIYDGVLKSMERQSSASKIEQVRQERAEASASLAKESVFERLMKGHAAVDMDIESPTISIGGKPHNLNEYRLDVFREGPAKLQTLIDRVTAHKDKYNAQIDSIHVQLANIMDDYGQISEKLKRVDNMIQTIEEEVDRDDEDEFNDAMDKVPQQSTIERIVEAVEVGTGNDQPMSSGESSGASFDPALFEHDEQGDGIEPGSRIEIEEGIFITGTDGRLVKVKRLKRGNKVIQASQWFEQANAKPAALLELTEKELESDAILRGIWKAILKVEIEPETDFFACGAGSMDVVRLVEEVKDTLEVPISNETLFMAPTYGEFMQEVVLRLRSGNDSVGVGANIGYDFRHVVLKANRREIVVPTQMFVSGRFIDAEGGKTLPIINPTTEQAICAVAAASKGDVDEAVKSADEAFRTVWTNVSARERGQISGGLTYWRSWRPPGASPVRGASPVMEPH